MKNVCVDCKPRDEEKKEKLIKRLNVINGQVNGIKQMLESNRSCEEILIQISAVTKSLKSTGNKILKEHMSNCMKNDFKKEDTTSFETIVALFEKFYN